jgi:hypothetical protein
MELIRKPIKKTTNGSLRVALRVAKVRLFVDGGIPDLMSAMATIWDQIAAKRKRKSPNQLNEETDHATGNKASGSRKIRRTTKSIG